VRPGLVTVGGLFVVLAVAALVSVNLFPTNTQVRDQNSLPAQPIAENATGVALLTGTNAAAGTFSVSWSASIPLTVALYAAPDCVVPRLGCAVGAPVWNTSRSTSGGWGAGAPFDFPYLLVWYSGPGPKGNFSASEVESYTVKAPMDLLSSLLIDGVAVALGVVGAVALFLGFFLRPGVYRTPPPLVSQSAEDVAEIAGPPDPRPPR
jgi:hypothetical protein